MKVNLQVIIFYLFIDVPIKDYISRSMQLLEGSQREMAQFHKVLKELQREVIVQENLESKIDQIQQENRLMGGDDRKFNDIY